MYDFSVALISSFGPFEIRQFKTNCSGLKKKKRRKKDWDSPHGVRNAYYVIKFCCFTHVFVDSGDLTDDCLNNCKSIL